MTNTEIIYRAMEKCGIKLPNIEIEKVEGSCIICGSKTVASKYSFIDTRLCTSCGTVAIDDVVVRSCLVNSRRVS